MKYQIIYADPCWSYKDKSKSHGGGAESHYSCMNINDICSLPIKYIADKNSTLFLWATMPMLREAIQVIEAWGFTYKTCAFTWIKGNKRLTNKQGVFFNFGIDDYMGMGRWTRANAELCLLATKGKPKRISAKVRQVVYSPLQNHSQKPAEVRERIVELMGDLPRIELFARDKVDGWHTWGNECECDIDLTNSEDKGE